MSNQTPSSPSGGRKQFMAMPPGDVAKTNDPKRFEARPQFKQQTFDEIYGAPENFLEIEVRGSAYRVLGSEARSTRVLMKFY